MKISKVTMISLGVIDLRKATAFYSLVLGTVPNTSSEAITFIELPGSWLALYPFEKLAADISPDVPTTRSGFGGVTLAHNARSKDEVMAIMARAEMAGAKVVKAPHDTFWGGFSGYFADPDGYYWEVAWGPMFEFNDRGDMTLNETA
jgi:catechol 2,3-dioxygenase-like lactoylglutathione lyase family enzyme